MKKTIALFLTTLMLLSAVSALAADYTELGKKLTLQLQNGSGFSGEAAFTAEPNIRLSFLDAQGNALINALLPGSVLQLKQITGAGLGNRDKEDQTLTLSRNGVRIADIKHTSDGVLEVFTSSLLADKSYVSSRGDGLLFSLLFDWDTTWPGVERAILAMSNADLEWRKSAEAQLKIYSDKLSLWLQGYTRFSNERDLKGQTVTVNEINISMAELKKEMKTLLSDVYANKTLLTLLRETMTSAEALAYLEPSMLQGFQAAIDALPVSGTASVLRRYDPAGKLLLEEVNLPMGGSRGIEHIHYRLEPFDQTQDMMLLEVQMLPVEKENEQGSFYSLKLMGGAVPDAVEGSDTTNYTGTLTLKEETVKNKGFTVMTPGVKDTRSFDFNLYIDHARLEQDMQTRQYSSQHEMSLVIKPTDQPEIGDQSIKLKLTLTSGASTNSSTKYTGLLVWDDLLTDASITAELSGGSTPPWVVPSVDAMIAARLDRMNLQELNLLKVQLKGAMLSGIAGLTDTLRLQLGQ